jgi:uncharacterized protein YndB with AHSA1/START domain
MATITKEYYFAAPPRLVWDALTNPQAMEGWGAGPEADLQLVEGGALRLWGGDVQGSVLDFESERRLVLEWRPANHDYATEVTLTFELAEEDEGTNLTIIQANAADEHVEEFDRGWDEYVGGPIKEFLEAQGV